MSLDIPVWYNFFTRHRILYLIFVVTFEQVNKYCSIYCTYLKLLVQPFVPDPDDLVGSAGLFSFHQCCGSVRIRTICRIRIKNSDPDPTFSFYTRLSYQKLRFICTHQCTKTCFMEVHIKVF